MELEKLFWGLPNWWEVSAVCSTASCLCKVPFHVQTKETSCLSPHLQRWAFQQINQLKVSLTFLSIMPISSLSNFTFFFFSCNFYFLCNLNYTVDVAETKQPREVPTSSWPSGKTVGVHTWALHTSQQISSFWATRQLRPLEESSAERSRRRWGVYMLVVSPPPFLHDAFDGHYIHYFGKLCSSLKQKQHREFY